MERLVLTLFGTATVAIGDRGLLHFRTDKIRALLVYLALEGDRPHHRQSLAALLWPEMPEQTAMKNLRQSLHRLQQTIDEQSPGLSEALFTVTRQTVQCDSALLNVDVLHFLALLAACERHPHQHLHLCHDCLDRLRSAAALYQGEMLAGFSLPDSTAFEGWLLFRRERLQQQISNALGRLAAALAERGEAEAAFSYAGRLAALDPFDEEAHRLLMRLLAAAGQYSKALAQYESCRRVLREELGVEPAAETTALYRQIQAAQQGKADISGGQPATLHHFPVQFTPFFGRRQESEQIEESFLDPECRLLTLLGPGGIGKSRLSLRAGERLAARAGFVDDVYFISLAAAQSTESLLTNILSGLGVTAAARSRPQESLFNYLRPRRCLLILDNFEQLVESASLLSEMLAAAPGLRLLLTSQLPLALQGERRMVIRGLDYPQTDEETADLMAYSSVRLFVESARLVEPTFRLEGNETAVRRICTLVQGMPLALELAAAWVQVMDCAAIVTEINRSLEFLSRSPQDKPERHQSMTAIFDYAWQLLAPAERKALGQMAVFRGPFSLEAAMTVAEATPLTLARLLDRSLVQRSRDGLYELHKLLAQFVDRQTAGQHTAAARRHSKYYLNLVVGQQKAFHGPQPRLAVAALMPYLDNIRRAWHWAIEQGDETTIEGSVEGLGGFYQTAALLQEGETMFAEAISRFGRLTSLLIWRATFLEKQGRHQEAIEQARIAELQAGDNEAMRAAVYSLLGKLLPHEGRFEEAVIYQKRAIDYYRTTGELERLAQSLRRMSIICWRATDYKQALYYCEQAIPWHRALGDKGGLAQLYSSLGGIYWEQGEVTQALAGIEQARELYEAVEDNVGLATVSGNLSILYAHLGQYESALAASQQAVEISQEIGDRYGLAMDLSNQGSILLAMQEFDRSLDCYLRAIIIETELGNQWGVAYHQAGAADVFLAKGDDETALTYFEQALPVLLAHGAPYYALSPILGKAEILYRRGDLEAARALNEQALALATELALPDFTARARALAAELDDSEKGRKGAHSVEQ